MERYPYEVGDVVELRTGVVLRVAEVPSPYTVVTEDGKKTPVELIKGRKK